MKLLKSYSYFLLYQALNIAIPFITIPYITRILGPEALGRYAFLNAISAYFIFIAGFALPIYGNREIAKVRANPALLQERFSQFFSLQFAMSGLSLLGYIIFAVQPRPLGGPPGLTWVFGALIASAVSDTSWLFMGLEEMRALAMRNLLVKVVSVLSMFALVHTPGDLTRFGWIAVFSTLAGNVYSIQLASRRVKFSLVGPRAIARTAWDAKGIFLPQLLMILYANADRVILGLNAKAEELAVYDQAQKVIPLLLVFTLTLRPIMITRLSNASTFSTDEERRTYQTRLFGFVGFIANFLCFGVMGASAAFVPWFFGPHFQGVAGVLPILAVILVVCSYGDVMINQIMIAMGKEREIMATLLIMFGLTLSLYYLLIPRYGAKGAASALVIANSLIMLVEWFFLRRELQVTKILFSAGRDLLAGAVMGGGIHLLGHFMHPTPLTTSFQILLGAATYSLFQLAMRNPVALRLREMAKDQLAAYPR